jgi:hypothetical protein
MAIFKLVCELITDIDIANDLYCPLTADVFADLLLLTSSLRLFLVIQDEALRFRLSCLFSTCVITTIVSLVNSLFILTSVGLKIVIITLIEVRKPLGVSSFNIKTDDWTALRPVYLSLLRISQFSPICFHDALNKLLMKGAEESSRLLILCTILPIHRYLGTLFSRQAQYQIHKVKNYPLVL